MTWLSENPWPLTIGLGVLGAISLSLLLATQRGLYLVGCLVCCGLAVLVLIVEGAWVTDREAIQMVVLDMADAVRQGDEDRVLSHLADGFDLQLSAAQIGRFTRDALCVESPTPDPLRDAELGSISLPGGDLMARTVIVAALSRYKLDLVSVTNWKSVSAGQQSRRGRAEFTVLARGQETTSGAGGTVKTTWLLGFRKGDDDVWRVQRIALVNAPFEINSLL